MKNEENSKHLSSSNMLELEDEIMSLKISIQKAIYTLQEVIEKHFTYENPKEHSMEITWEYDRYSTLAQITNDYLHQSIISVNKILNTKE